jgi:steroid 5-alpha reductase family enzyme
LAGIGGVIQLFLASWFGLAIVMSVLWARQLRTQNATSVDVAWSFGLAALALVYGVFAEAPFERRLLVGGLALVWALRLGLFLLFNRVLGHTEEDGRYRAMREHWGASAARNFFWVYQAQAAVAMLFSIPVLAAMSGGALDGFALAGVAVWAIAVGGETVADRQLAAFRGDPANRGRVCRVGLWRYSRHPNYFFEWVHWWTYVLIGHGAILTWVGPVFMLLFLFRISGIPYTELQAIKSRGEEYREYQRTTSAFVPWFPRRQHG